MMKAYAPPTDAAPGAAGVLPLPGTMLCSALTRFAGRMAGDVMLQKSALSIADQAIVSATNFAVTVLLGRLCGKPEVGLYYLALQLVFFARGIQEQLISSPYLVYAGRRQGREAATFAGSNLAHETTLLGFVALLLAGAALCGGVSADVTALLWLLAAAAPLMLLREYVRQIAFAELRILEALILDAIVCGLQLGGLLIAASYGLLSTWLTFAVLATGCALATVGWFILRRGTFVLQRDSIGSDWIHNWRFGRWALASQLLGSSMPFVLPWVVAGTHGEAETGSLGVGTTLVGFANMFVLGLSNFICPRAARAYAGGGAGELIGVLKQATAMYLILLVPFAALTLLAGRSLMIFVYGPDFGDAGLILGVLACGAVANSLGITAGNGLWAMELPSANFRADVCALATWLTATAVLVPPYGAMGAAIASVTGTVVGAIVRGAVLMTELRQCRAATA